MKKIRCIETSGYKLTEGKEYDLLKSEGGFHFLVNDNGKTVRYNSDFFEEVEDVPVEVIAPPPPPARTEQDLINSIMVQGDNITFVDFDNNNKSITKKLNSENHMGASCGIGDVMGLLDTTTNIDNIVNNLNHDDDLIRLRKALFRKSIEQYILVNPDSNRGAYIASCNINDVDGDGQYLTEDYVTVLDGMANVTSKVFENPNSDNNIKFWIFYRD